jgi:hypothetical protein
MLAGWGIDLLIDWRNEMITEWNDNLMGRRVAFSHRYTRRTIGKRREWVKCDHEASGMIIGRRWIKNGEIDIHGYCDETGEDWIEDYRYFVPTETIPCLLVVTNDRSNPIYVPYKCVTEIEE